MAIVACKNTTATNTMNDEDPFGIDEFKFPGALLI